MEIIRNKQDLKWIYISGQISGLAKEVYHNKFMRAEQYLLLSGYAVLNPITIGEASYSSCMLRCIEMMKMSDGIYFLDNWTLSNGAKIEKEFAELMSVINPDYLFLYE